MALTAFWRAEGTTLDGTHDYTDSDTTVTLNNTAAINTDFVFVGTNSLDCSDNTDGGWLDQTTNELLDYNDGACGFAFYVNGTWGAGGLVAFVDVSETADHIEFNTTGSGGSGNVSMEIAVNLAGSTTVTTSGANLDAGNWYFVIGRWNYTDQDLRVEVYNSSGTELGTAGFNGSVSQSHFPTAIDRLSWGPVYTGAALVGTSCHYDNIFMADTYSEAIEDNHDITSYTEYGGGAASTAKNLLLLGVG